jgi:pyruvate dehydrogenase (quinone)
LADDWGIRRVYGYPGGDSGSGTDWWARHMKVRLGMQAALSGTLATMCPAIPYALAAKFAYPERPVIANLGDGAFQMLGMNALIDIAHYTPRWSDLLNNRDLNQVTWEQRVMSGDPKLDASQVLPSFDYAGFARMLGLHGARVERPEDIGAAWDEALAAGRPAVIEFVTDPEVPPLPPKCSSSRRRCSRTRLPRAIPRRRASCANRCAASSPSS